MHNRKRAEGPIDPLIVAASRKKAEAYRGLSRLAFKQVSFDFSHSLPSLLVSQLAEGGDVSAQLLSLNPELYSLWNHRRRLIIQATSTPSVTPNVTSNETSNVKLETDLKPSDDTMSTSSSSSSSSSSLISSSILLERELAVTEAAIKRNPKSYHAWHHRRWSITTLCGLEDRNHSTCLLIPTTPFNASQEFALCEKLFLLDERNFHCWNYRRWVAESFSKVQGKNTQQEDDTLLPLKTELEYTLSCIHRNFSNYSAWHQRSCLLTQRARLSPVSIIDLTLEFILVRKAVFTEPDDQSPWFYRRWVVTELCKHLNEKDSLEWENCFEAIYKLLIEDCLHLQTLIEAEPRCRWPVAALVHTQQTFDKSMKGMKTCSLIGNETIEGLIHTLKEIDPLRIRYYEHLV
jgi:geranylgeranyl transferase type-2 subunit alpha